MQQKYRIDEEGEIDRREVQDENWWWWWSVHPQRNQYNFLKENNTLEEVKIAAFAILGQFGAEYKKIALCAICVWCTWGKRTGLD